MGRFQFCLENVCFIGGVAFFDEVDEVLLRGLKLLGILGVGAFSFFVLFDVEGVDEVVSDEISAGELFAGGEDEGGMAVGLGRLGVYAGNKQFVAVDGDDLIQFGEGKSCALQIEALVRMLRVYETVLAKLVQGKGGFGAGVSHAEMITFK